MTVFLISASEFRTSQRGGLYKLCIFKNVDSSDKKTYKLYVYDNHSMSKRFFDYLKPGNIFENMEVLAENKDKNYLNGCSDFKLNGNVYEQRKKVS